MSDEINVNSENTPRKNLATLGQVKDALDKRDKKIDSLKSDIANKTGTGLSTEAIDKLEEVGNYLAYTTADGGSKWTELISILRNGSSGGGSGETVTLQSISATYTGGDVPVGTSVNSLTGLTVTATYSDGSTSNVTGYTLSGTIAEGSNTIAVSYSGKTTTFTVIGVAESSGEDTEPFVNLFNVNLRSTTTEDKNAGIGTYVNHYINTDQDIQLAAGVTYYVYSLFNATSCGLTLFVNDGTGAYTRPEYTASKAVTWLSGTYDDFGNEIKLGYTVGIDGTTYTFAQFSFTPTEDCAMRFAFSNKCVGHIHPEYNYLFTKEYNPHKDILE